MPKDVYVDKIISVDKYEDVQVEKIIEKQVEVQKNVEIQVDKVVTKYVEVPIETYKDVIEEKEIIVPVERIVEKKI